MPAKQTEAQIRESLFSNVRKTDSGCWESLRYKNEAGYTHCGWKGKYHNSHRVAYIITYGEIPNHELVLHKCDNRICINPDHLFLGSQKDNMADCKNKGRRFIPSGIKNHFSKLTDAKILKILSLLRLGNLSQQKIADRFGVQQACISKIYLGKTWKHVTAKLAPKT